MKLIFVLALASCIPETAETTQELNGDVWTTVDDYDNNGLGALYNAAAIGYGGILFVVGDQTEAAGGSSWLVRTSTTGTTFTTAWTFQYAPGQPSEAVAIVYDPPGRVFISGWAVDAAGLSHLVTILATDSSRKIVDDVVEPAGTFVGPKNAVVFDNLVFVIAHESDGTTDRPRIRYSQTGLVWKDFPVPANGDVPGALCVTDIGLTATGYRAEPFGADLVTMATAASSLGKWSRLDVLPGTSTKSYVGLSCTEVNGYLYALAAAGTGGQDTDWVVRRGTPSAGWLTDDDMPVPVASWGGPIAIGPGPSGRVYVTGQLSTSPFTGAPLYTRRRDPTGTWVDSDSFGVNNIGAGTAVLTSTLGTYVLGSTFPSAIVRKLQ